MSGDFQLGTWVVPPSLNTISSNGKTCRLEPKMLEVLVYLAEHPREVVPKEQLMNAVWPDTFVTDDVLTRCISELRKAFGDDAKEPHVIETIPRRGYRLLAKVSPITTRRRRTAVVVGLTLLTVLVLAVAFVLLRKPPEPPKLVRTTPLTRSRAIAEITTHLGSDGSRIYFSQLAGDHVVVVQVSASGGDPVSVPTPSGEDWWFYDVSPEGSQLLLANSMPLDDGPIWIMPAVGGSARRLGDATGHDPAWSADGQSIVFGRGHDLYTVNKDGVGARKIATLDGTPRWPCWSPDGSRVRFSVVLEKDNSSLWEVSSTGNNLHPLLPRWSDAPNVGPGHWMPDGRNFVFLANRNGLWSIWAMAESSGWLRNHREELVQLTSGPIDMSDVLPSKDGRRIFATGEQRLGELVRFDPKAGQFTPYLSGISADGLTFSRDGQWIAYVTYPDGILWSNKVDGSRRVQMTSPPLRVLAPRWSPDGQHIAFSAWAPGQEMKAYLISATGGSPEPLVSTPGSQIAPSWSADGNTLIFGVKDSGSFPDGLYSFDLPSRKLTQLPGLQGKHNALWSPDGRYIVSSGPNGIALFDFRQQQWTSLLPDPPLSLCAWSHDGKYLYLDRGEKGIFRVRISDRSEEKIADAKNLSRASGDWGSWFGLTPDDSPLLLRSLGSQQIYALDLESH
jgi:Tol biopolymer transport system component/DNA-binding winged helix-turn-helix (wHTH) protein